jgi:hypothetical protein
MSIMVAAVVERLGLSCNLHLFSLTMPLSAPRPYQEKYHVEIPAFQQGRKKTGIVDTEREESSQAFEEACRRP